MSKLIKHRKRLDKRGFKIAIVPVIGSIGNRTIQEKQDRGFRPVDEKHEEILETDVSKALRDLLHLHRWFEVNTGQDNPQWATHMKNEPDFQDKMLEYVNEHGLPFDKLHFQPTSITLRHFFMFVCNISETMKLGYENKIDEMFDRQGFLDSHFVLQPKANLRSTLTMEFRAETLRDALIGEVWEKAKQIGRFKLCPVCDTFFECKTRQDQKFCSDACKAKNYRFNKELKKMRGK